MEPLGESVSEDAGAVDGFATLSADAAQGGGVDAEAEADLPYNAAPGPPAIVLTPEAPLTSDELTVTMIPVVLGAGRPLFAGVGNRHDLRIRMIAERIHAQRTDLPCADDTELHLFPQVWLEP